MQEDQASSEKNEQGAARRQLRSAELVKRGATMEDVAKEFEPAAQTPAEAITRLKNGNARYFSNQSLRSPLSPLERRAQVVAQTPFAIVLGCADSRVPTENIFDQSSGELFTIRVAGNVIGGNVLASIEYAIEHLKSHLVVVMGHEGCGAVNAAMLSEDKRRAEPENVQALLERIVPAVSNLPKIRDGKARMREAVIANVRLQVHELKQNRTIIRAIERKQIEVVGAYYEISSGAVDFFETEDELRLDD